MIVYVAIIGYRASLQERIEGVYDSEYKATVAMKAAVEKWNSTCQTGNEQEGEVKRFEIK